MRFGILSDIHGNEVALKECLKFIDENNIDEIIWCGDYITDFPRSHEVIELIKTYSKKYKSYIIKGNREDKVLDYINGKDFNIRQKRNLDYTSKSLSEEDIKWIKSLPDYLEIEANNKKIFLSHEFNKANKGYDYKIFGHTHIQEIFVKNDVKYINSGSVGITADGKVGAELTILELKDNKEVIEQHLIQYDMDEVIQELKTTSIYNDDVKWGRLLEKELVTGLDYPQICFDEYEKLLKEKQLEESIEIWNETIKNVL